VEFWPVFVCFRVDFLRFRLDFGRKFDRFGLCRHLAAPVLGAFREKLVRGDESRRLYFSLHKPFRPEVGMAAGATGVERCGMGVGAVGPRRVGGNEPALHVPEHSTGDAAEDRTGSPRRELPAGVGEIRFSDLPVDHVGPAGTEGAERDFRGAIGAGGIVVSQIGTPGLEGADAPVGEGDVDLGGTAKQVAGFCGNGGSAAGLSCANRGGRKKIAGHGSPFRGRPPSQYGGAASGGVWLSERGSYPVFESPTASGHLVRGPPAVVACEPLLSSDEAGGKLEGFRKASVW
jgi:hypothetical protein